jgi:hypothetical protein
VPGPADGDVSHPVAVEVTDRNHVPVSVHDRMAFAAKASFPEVHEHEHDGFLSEVGEDADPIRVSVPGHVTDGHVRHPGPWVCLRPERALTIAEQHRPRFARCCQIQVAVAVEIGGLDGPILGVAAPHQHGRAEPRRRRRGGDGGEESRGRESGEEHHNATREDP